MIYCSTKYSIKSFFVFARGIVWFTILWLYNIAMLNSWRSVSFSETINTWISPLRVSQQEKWREGWWPQAWDSPPLGHQASPGWGPLWAGLLLRQTGRQTQTLTVRLWTMSDFCVLSLLFCLVTCFLVYFCFAAWQGRTRHSPIHKPLLMPALAGLATSGIRACGQW